VRIDRKRGPPGVVRQQIRLLGVRFPGDTEIEENDVLSHEATVDTSA
jgi:hypothetical protein